MPVISMSLLAPQQCHLSVPINASCLCSSMPPASAHQCLINATYQCLPCTSMPHISAHLSCL
ncbi:unnamed protein product [Staurois parvus]|uniref:Uncharacterized protein n=1 Tax=Staurois parvus TaxID=386267 RepID=A0ABN9GPD8_9NEOB|nr:unnamed protein product [Staurois parvus]